jgi:hypothetical protein
MSAVETPAQMLRRAAEKMRALAGAATAGPWRATPHGRPPTQSWYVTGLHTLITTGLHEDIDDHELVAIEHDRADAQYIAAVHPGIGLLVADQWDAIADDMRDDEVVERGTAGIGVLVAGCLFSPRKTWTAAVAAARTFLDEENAP